MQRLMSWQLIPHTKNVVAIAANLNVPALAVANVLKRSEAKDIDTSMEISEAIAEETREITPSVHFGLIEARLVPLLESDIVWGFYGEIPLQIRTLDVTPRAISQVFCTSLMKCLPLDFSVAKNIASAFGSGCLTIDDLSSTLKGTEELKNEYKASCLHWWPRWNQC